MRAGRKPLPREHGTARGFRQHRNRGETPCEACAPAGHAYWSTRAAAEKAAHAASRARAAEAEQAARRAQRHPVWAAHEAGTLVLGGRR